MGFNKIENSLWVEKYRPRVLEDYVGNQTVIDTIQRYIDNDDIPSLLLHGSAGTGKTTLGKIIVNTLDCDCLYINASDENNIDTVRDKIKTFVSSVGFKKWKIVFLDESDYLTANAQSALRNLIETFSKHSRFILTCNYVEKILDPIQSRCTSFQIHPPTPKDIAKRLYNICNQENVECDIKDIVAIVKQTYPDIRRSIMALQQQCVDGKLVLTPDMILESGYLGKILDELKAVKDPKTSFKNIRQIIADSKARTFESLYKFLYDNLDDISSKNQAAIILAIAKYQYQDSFVVDKEINVMAMLLEIFSEL